LNQTIATSKLAGPVRKIVLDCFGASPAFVAGHFFSFAASFRHFLACVELADQISKGDCAIAGHQ
jgi:hypothetical protein